MSFKKEARWWTPLPNGRIRCELCPRYCKLADGQTGFCGVRQALGGRLVTLVYGKPAGLAVDPIEKKPLFHFLPASLVLSFGTVGCQLGCRYCQNWHLSRESMTESNLQYVEPGEIVRAAEANDCPSIAYTYNEPIIFAEYLIDIARLARNRGLLNVMVTNGYVSNEARAEVFDLIDGVNVDLKAFDEGFYRKYTLSSLKPVLETLIWIRTRTRAWLEITTLLIPGLNDAEDQILSEVHWILDNLGRDVPLHFTAFRPDYKMLDHPPTDPETLRRARDIALREGIQFVYVGNVADPAGQTTYCPSCGATLIARTWHASDVRGLDGNKCKACGATIPGVFEPSPTG